jgi:diaminohydroxyphosphoribosylaminopyrimidine deaminase/5-amino-6-(5-phosphoribosylamino)uracil reductase
MNDLLYLSQALELAKKRIGFCAPNPSVGALVVNSQDEIIARGYHFESGAPHAEVEAINNLNDIQLAKEATLKSLNDIHLAKGATLYVTLEPCCHWGKTPPCTDLIIKSGIKRVVYGYKDPNPIIAGKGALALEAAGIRCDYIAPENIQSFYAAYHHWMMTKRPFVTAKIAMTLNGKIAGPNGERKQITGIEAQEFTHDQRKKSDAILTTANTIISDNPQLNVRHSHEVIPKPIYILDSELKTPLSANIFTTSKSITLFHKKTVDPEKKQAFQAKGARCIEVDNTSKGLVLTQILDHIGAEGMHHLWIEAGGTLFAALLTEHLIQCAFIYVAPQWMSGKSAFPDHFSFEPANHTIRWVSMGNDVLCKMRLQPPNQPFDTHQCQEE